MNLVKAIAKGISELELISAIFNYGKAANSPELTPEQVKVLMNLYIDYQMNLVFSLTQKYQHIVNSNV